MAAAPDYTPGEIELLARMLYSGATTKQIHEEFERRWPGLRSYSGVARARSQHFGVAAALKRLEEGGSDIDPPPMDDSPVGYSRTIDETRGDTRTIIAPRGPEFTTPADLLDRAQVPYERHEDGRLVPLHWTIDRQVLNEWPTTMRGTDGEPITVPNWQCKLSLTRRTDAPALKAMESILEQIGKLAPKYPKIPRKKIRKGEGFCGEISIPDLHMGKLAHRLETGSDVDTVILKERYLDAVRDFLGELQEKPLRQLLFLVGSDMFTSDSSRGETFAGTKQDLDTRQWMVIDATYQMLVEAIDMCSTVAPVIVKKVKGNHDKESADAAAMFLSAWYRNQPAVEIDTSPFPRKYHTFGKNLIGFAHGDQERLQALPNIMAQEMPQEWAATRYREWHLGHVHRKKEMTFLSVDEISGVRCRHLPSLAGADAWHAEKGYHAQVGAEAFLWSEDRGLRAILNYHPAS